MRITDLVDECKNLSSYETFQMEIQDVLIRNFAQKSYEGDWIIEEAMAQIRGVCENYGMDWKLEEKWKMKTLKRWKKY